MYILRPHAAGILYAPPPFYTPPTPRRVFSGVGGWGCIKFGPVTKMNFWGPETASWGGGLPREGMVVEKLVPSLESLFFPWIWKGGTWVSREF